MNRWKIPPALEREVIARDRRCIYCGVSFEVAPATRGTRPTWEHIVNDARIINSDNMARCCCSCNASKGARELAVWLRGKYCQRRGISADSIAEVARRALAKEQAA